LEYCRKIPLQVPEGAAPANNTMSFGAVTLAEETAGEGSQVCEIFSFMSLVLFE
jgi:hypothetical protein